MNDEMNNTNEYPTPEPANTGASATPPPLPAALPAHQATELCRCAVCRENLVGLLRNARVAVRRGHAFRQLEDRVGMASATLLIGAMGFFCSDIVGAQKMTDLLGTRGPDGRATGTLDGKKWREPGMRARAGAMMAATFKRHCEQALKLDGGAE